MNELTEHFKIIEIIEGKRITKTDEVIKEGSLTIYVNKKELITLLCSPDHLKYLAIGFLFSEGIIEQKNDIKNINFNDPGKIFITLKRHLKDTKNRPQTSCSSGGKILSGQKYSLSSAPEQNFLRVNAELIYKLMHEFESSSTLFKNTGGTHSFALCKDSNFLLFREDIGRHNAVDKIIGECLLNNIHTNDKIALTSGRTSWEIVNKIAKAQIPILVSKSAPTSEGIKLANELELTLIGFARGRRMNIYTHDFRLN